MSRGIPRLRRALCRWYADRYGVELDPEREAIVTIGSKEGIAHLALATLGRGDTVLVPNPSYPIHIYGPVIAGADIRHVPMTTEAGFLAALEQTIHLSFPKPRMLIVGFPSNPTAQCVELEFFESWSRWRGSTASGSCTTSPTPTSRSTAGRRHRSWRCPARATSPWSSSRCRRATTWPAGASASWSATRELVPRWRGSRATTITAPSRRSRWRRSPRWRVRRTASSEIAATYQRRRNVLCKGLHRGGVEVEMPKASMYIWAKIPEAYRADGVARVRQEAARRARRSRCRRGSASASIGDDHVRFALIENESADPPGDARHQARCSGRTASSRPPPEGSR